MEGINGVQLLGSLWFGVVARLSASLLVLSSCASPIPPDLRPSDGGRSATPSVVATSSSGPAPSVVPSPGYTSSPEARVSSASPQPTLAGRLAFDTFADIFVLNLPSGAVTQLTDDPAPE